MNALINYLVARLRTGACDACIVHACRKGPSIVVPECVTCFEQAQTDEEKA